MALLKKLYEHVKVWLHSLRDRQVYINPYTVKQNCCFDIKFVTSLAQVKIIDTRMPFKNNDYKITFKLPNHSSSLELSLKNDGYQYFPTPKSQQLGKLLKNDAFEYFQTPNHSSSQSPLTNDVYQYFPTPKSQQFVELPLKNEGYKYFQPSRPPCLVNNPQSIRFEVSARTLYTIY